VHFKQLGTTHHLESLLDIFGQAAKHHPASQGTCVLKYLEQYPVKSGREPIDEPEVQDQGTAMRQSKDTSSVQLLVKSRLLYRLVIVQCVAHIWAKETSNPDRLARAFEMDVLSHGESLAGAVSGSASREFMVSGSLAGAI
jgi:hypothetical protein